MTRKSARSRSKTKRRTAATSAPPPEQVAAEGANGPAAEALGPRLRQLRTQRKMSQGDVEKRTGLLRCYISRVEGGHTVPSLQTLEKFAAALAVPLHTLFYQGKGIPEPLPEMNRVKQEEVAPPDPIASKLRRLIRKMDDRGRRTLLDMMRKLAFTRE